MIRCAKCRCEISYHHRFRLSPDKEQVAEHVDCNSPLENSYAVSMNKTVSALGRIISLSWERPVK